jgi:hypothetical protein
VNLKREGDLAVGYWNHFGQLSDPNPFGNFVVAVVASGGMAIQKHRALIARIHDFQTRGKRPQILKSGGVGLHSLSIPERAAISNNYLTNNIRRNRLEYGIRIEAANLL